MCAPLRIDLAGFAREATLGDHRALMGLVERADALGFDAIWFNEFHFRRDDLPYPSLLLLGAEILGRTQRLRFGTSVMVLPIYHPLMLAEQLAQLDFQSGGRLDVGIGRGTEPSTLTTLGISPDDARARFVEALDIIVNAWTLPQSSATGPNWQFTDVAVGPPPVQRPYPPLYVAGVSPETIAMAVARKLPLLLSLEPNEARQLPEFRGQLARAGRSLQPLAASSLSRYVLIGATAAAVDEQIDTLLTCLNDRCAAMAAKRGQPAPEKRSREALLADFAIAGTPEACQRQIEDLRARTGVNGLRCFFSANGLISNADALSRMEMFAREVMPGLRETQLSPRAGVRHSSSVV